MRTIPFDRKYVTVPELVKISGRTESMVRNHIDCGILPSVDLKKLRQVLNVDLTGHGQARLKVGILRADAEVWLSRFGKRRQTLLPPMVPDVWVPVWEVRKAVGALPSRAYDRRYKGQSRDMELPGRGRVRVIPLSLVVSWWNERVGRQAQRNPMPFPFEKFTPALYPLVEGDPLGHEREEKPKKGLMAKSRALIKAGWIVRVEPEPGPLTGLVSNNRPRYELHPDAVRALGGELEPAQP